MTLQTKNAMNQLNRKSRSYTTQFEYDQSHSKRSSTRSIEKKFLSSIDLNFENSQLLICYVCGNKNHRNQCQKCSRKGYIQSDHPLVSLMNDIFNSKLIGLQSIANKKQVISTKTSSKSSASQSFYQSQILNVSIQMNEPFQQKKPFQNHRTSILQFMLTPLQTIIKEESTTEEKLQKCKICHYEFDGVKYKCFSCENYNVCQSCYLTKRIDHCHGLKKMHSATSQKTANAQDKDSETLKNSIQKNQNNDEKENTHSEVDKLSLKSDEYVDLVFKGLDMKNQHKYSLFQDKNPSFFQMHQVKFDDEKFERTDGYLRQCQSCHTGIDGCYWICQTCVNQSNNYLICKNCYDSEIQQHPSNHHLGFKFLETDTIFLEPQKDIYIQSNLKQKKNGRPNPFFDIISTIKKVEQKKDEGIKSIGVIGHRDIFTGFHKPTHNDSYPDQIISPIPRSIANNHPFKQKIPSRQSDNDTINQFIQSPSPSNIKDSIETEQITLKNFNDQSRVEIDDNIMIDLGIIADSYDLQMENVFQDHIANFIKPLQKSPIEIQTKKQLQIHQNNPVSQHQSLKSMLSSQKKKKYSQGKNIQHQCQNTALPDLGYQFKSISDINPEASILQVNEGEFIFLDYYCDICAINPIKNVKYHCLECDDYDLCSDCYQNRRIQHWHNHFRKDDGKMKWKKLKQQKEKLMIKVIESNMNRSISPTRRSIRFIK